MSRFILMILLLLSVSGQAAPDAASLEAIRQCRDFIRQTQLPDGAFRVSCTGDVVRIWPYFGNVAAGALIVAHRLEPQPEDLVRVKRWLDWYAAHQRADGNIPDFLGTRRDYKPSPKRKAIDVYPPTYLSALRIYREAQPEGLPAAELLKRAGQALHAIESALDPADDLTWSSTPHLYKYPMDNVDVCIGLLDGARLFEALGAREQAERCRALVARISTAIAKFWLPEQGHFAWAQGQSPKVRTFEKPYPDGVANIYLALTIDPPPPKLWDNLRRQFGTAPRITPDLWLLAARRCGTPEQVKDFTAAAIGRVKSGDLTLQTASRLLLALAGDVAAPVVVPMKLGRK